MLVLRSRDPSLHDTHYMTQKASASFFRTSSSSSSSSSSQESSQVKSPVKRARTGTPADKSQTFQGHKGTELLEAAIPLALEAGTTSLSIVDCHPGQEDADSDADSDQLVLVLVKAMGQCETLALERFSLLSSDDLQSIFEYATDRGSLNQLSLSQVSNMDGPALAKLAGWLSKTRKLGQLRLGGLAPCDTTTCQQLAQALSASAVQALVLQDCAPRFLLGFLKAMNRLPKDTPLSLCQLDISYAIPGDAGGQASADGQMRRDEIDREVAALMRRFVGVRCATEVRIAPADTLTDVDVSPLDRSPEATSLTVGKDPRVTRIGEQLKVDQVRPDQYPSQGRVRCFLLDEDYVHDPRDEPDIIDWCVAVAASGLLSDSLLQWRRSSVYLQDSSEAKVLSAGITAAMEAGAKHIALVRSLPGHHPNAAGSWDLTFALIEAARRCESLTLKDFRLLMREQMSHFLEWSANDCSLDRLTLSGLPDMDVEAMNLLVRMVLRSHILHLSLDDVDCVVLTRFLALLHEHSQYHPMRLVRLDLSYTLSDKIEEHIARSLINDIDLQIGLLGSLHPQLDIYSKRFLVVLEDRPTSSGTDQPPPGGFNPAMTMHDESYRPATPPSNILELWGADALEPAREEPALQGIQWNPRVVRCPAFLADIAKGLGILWNTEESIRQSRLQALNLPAVPMRIALALTDDDPSKLKWIREINRGHRELWDATYAIHLEALAHGDMAAGAARAREDMQTIKEMEDLLVSRMAHELIRYVKRLREQNQLPSSQSIESLLSRHGDDPQRTIALAAFKLPQLIQELVHAGRFQQLHMWANTLKREDALPSLDAIQPLMDRYPEGPVAQALSRFRPSPV